MLRLVALVSFIDDDNRWAFGLVVEAALPVLLVAPLAVAEVSIAVEHQQVLSAAL